MNFVGKMLVIVIMIFSVVFMGLTTVVFKTAETYKDISQKAQTDLTKAKNDLQAKDQLIEEAKVNVAAVQKQLEEEKVRHQGELAQLVNLRNSLEEQRTSLEEQRQVTQQSMETAQSEASYRIKEAAEIRDKLSKTQDDANNLQREKTDLNARIFELDKQLATALQQNKKLRDDLQSTLAYLQSIGRSVDLAQLSGLSVPPAGLEGVVRRADARNPQKAELSIGSDDGLKVGHEMVIYRKSPPSYIGKVKIIIVEPDQAVGEVIGRTYNGKRIQEGDIVSSTLPRSN